MPLTSTQLALLTEVQRTGSLARAALNLGVTPPAVSQQLARLEKEVGVALVERGARGARLTPLGEQLAEHGLRVTEELQRADDLAAEFVGAHLNRLRVGGPPSISKALLPPVLANLRYRHPSAELSVVDVMSDAGIDLVADGVLDVALCADYGTLGKDDRVTIRQVFSDPMLVVLPDDHALARDGADAPLDLADLAASSWVSGPPGRPTRLQLDDAAADAGFVPRVPFQTESYDVAQALSEAGVAVSLIPRLAFNALSTTRARRLSNALVREIVAVIPTSIDHVPLAAEFLRGLEQMAAAHGDDA
jgi:DNA-binding transcriptional LysR family regulator